MPFLRHSLIVMLLCASCATPPTAHSTPALPMEEFIAQVLDPLAGQIADEWAEESKAEYAANHPTSMQKPSTGSTGGAASGGGPGGMLNGFLGGIVAASNQEAIQKYNAEIDARQQPVKKELLALFTRRAKSVGDQYSVCVDGAERRYGIKDNRFIRLEDGPGPCEKTLITTKGAPESNDR
jgi:hypothetical protein